MSPQALPATTRERPTLSGHQLERLGHALGLPPTASESAILREWARQYWWNHCDSFENGDPLQLLPREIPVSLAQEIWEFYESDYRSVTDTRP